ncbi:MAG: hypothetical protein E7233_00380 [Lachnospiraceae bacterium]|nr:hypothetical protein [Lachnospiraceae bacterium]
MIISVCGPIGYETAAKLSDMHREELKERFPSFFLRQFEEIEDETIDSCPETGDGILYCRQITEGGVYRALWEAGETLGCGMKVANRDIPIRQEVIEILELYGETPYECSSRGSLLIVTDKMIDEIICGGRHVPAFMIGITTGSNARVLEDKDSLRYLTPPSRQEKDIADRKNS